MWRRVEEEHVFEDLLADLTPMTVDEAGESGNCRPRPPHARSGGSFGQERIRSSPIRTPDDIIENVSRSAPALAPLFRSDQQLAILTLLFGESIADVSIGELAERAGVAQATASREVARLAKHGLVVTRSLGRNTLVTANWDLPWAKELRSILMQTVGVLGRLGDVLSAIDGAEEAFIFGSWAARYTGEPGHPPRDVDVVIIGDVALRTVRRACRAVEEDLRSEVNPVVVDRARWDAKSPEPFIAQIRSKPLVSIRLER